MPYFGKVPPSDLYNLFLAVIVNPIVTSKYDNDMWHNNRIAGKIRKWDAAFSAESFATILNSRVQVLHFADSKAETTAFVKCDVEKLLPHYKNIVYPLSAL